MHSTEEDERFWPKMDENRPSRAHAIEELPVALASLLYGQGDFVRTIEACVRYGRDCDSIACIACGLLGALAGGAVFPGELVQASEHVNKRDYRGLADILTSTCRKILTQDSTLMEKRANSILAGISWRGHGL
jgi:ADP-ribosylglycohydrolase